MFQEAFLFIVLYFIDTFDFLLNPFLMLRKNLPNITQNFKKKISTSKHFVSKFNKNI